MRKLYSVMAIVLLSLTGWVEAASSAASGPATRIETDQKTGTILFIVDGKEQARIDKGGLHVRENIDYNGVLTDGSSVYPIPPATPAR